MLSLPLGCNGASSTSNQTISGARPVFVTLYMPQHVFTSPLARSIWSGFSVVQLGKRRASASVSLPVAPRALVPGRKQTRWSIFGESKPPTPLGSSATKLSFASLVGMMRCLRMPASASSQSSEYRGSCSDICRYCLMRYSVHVSWHFLYVEKCYLP